MKRLFDLVLSNGGWDNSLIRGKNFDFLQLANDTIHGSTGPMNELAIKESSSAIETYPLDAGFYSDRSACHKSIKKFEAAIDDALPAKHLRPDWSKPHFRLAVCLLEMQKFEDATCSAWEGLELDQKNNELKALLQKCVKLGKKTHNETHNFYCGNVCDLEGRLNFF